MGHLTAALTGLAWAPFVPNREDAPFPRTPTERRDLGPADSRPAHPHPSLKPSRRTASVWEHRRMNPPDDPEARIRDLERPLADVANTSELGTGQYPGGYGSAPPPPPPGYYGTLHAVPDATDAGKRWLSLVVVDRRGVRDRSGGDRCRRRRVRLEHVLHLEPVLERLGRPTEHLRWRWNPHLRPIEPTDRPRRQDPDAERRTAGGRRPLASCRRAVASASAASARTRRSPATTASSASAASTTPS